MAVVQKRDVRNCNTTPQVRRVLIPFKFRIIAQLGEAAIGTDDHEILGKIISDCKPHIVITVSWPDGKRPPDLSLFI